MTEQERRNLLTRRQTIGIAGLAGVAFVAGRGPIAVPGVPAGAISPELAEAGACVLTPDKTEGPFFVDELLNRSDIRANADGSSTRPGFRFDLTITVLRADADCAPAQGAVVDIWHCDAAGKYSDISSEGTAGQTWLRGLQTTDSQGKATFTTIYPGWYPGRAVHIHFKVRTFENDNTTYEYTSQLFFDPALNDTLQADATYSGPGTTANAQDGIYAGDTELLVPLSGSQSSGFAGAIAVGLSGLPGGSEDPTDDGKVDAKLLAAGFSRNAKDRRVLTLKLRAGEAVRAEAKLVRGQNVLGRAEKGLDAGRSKLRLKIDDDAEGGAAKLKLKLTDAGGNRKTVKRTLGLPG